MIQQYVLCFVQPRVHQWWPEVLLIEKKRPAWQAGKFNLPGGHVEEGETIHEAASRELYEETGIDCPVEHVHLMGTIEGDFGVVYVMTCRYDSLRGANVAESITSERVFWLPIEEAFREERLIGNLRVVIPLVRSGLTGWTLKGDSETGDFYISHTLETPGETSEVSES